MSKLRLFFFIATVLSLVCFGLFYGCKWRPWIEPGEIESTCRCWATPPLVRRGAVEFRVALRPNIFPGVQGGRNLKYSAYATDDPGRKLVGVGKEDYLNPENYEFCIEFDRGGDWVIDLVATWPDGAFYRSERLLIHDVP